MSDRAKRLGRSALRWAGLAIVVVGVVLYAGGFFAGERISPGDSGTKSRSPAPARTAAAELVRVDVLEDAVGTVRSRRTVAVAAQISARVLAVEVEAGERVESGAVLARLDDRELAARLAQARQAVAAAEAGIGRAQQSKAQADARASQARAARERVASLLTAKAATAEQMEEAEAAFLAGEASVAEAEAAIAVARAERERASLMASEAEVAHGYTRITSPIDGVVSERAVESGDLALPGRTLFVVLDPSALRLEARVREGLIGRLRAGDELEVLFETLGLRARARVAELLPSADARSRTFEVRAEFDPLEGVRPGMFGRLRIPSGAREVVLAPRAAVVSIGQLRTVLVEDQGEWKRRLVTLGASYDGDSLEILSGLAGGERLGLAEEVAK